MPAPRPRPLPIALVCVAALFGSTQCAASLLGENAAYGLQEAACPQLALGAGALRADFRADARISAHVGAFVAASAGLVKAAKEAESVAASACRAIGADLGIPARRMQGSAEPGGDAAGACSAVAAEVQSILRGGVSISVRARPPRCEASAEARADCRAACTVELTPAEIVARCDPGQLSGRCEGTCGGRCEGTCRGACEGECAARGAGGDCAGRCEGQCRGECRGTCHARCEGEWRAPRCEADITPPRAEGSCDASCSTYAELEARCSPARVDVETSADVQRVAVLAASLREHLPELLRAQLGIARRLVGHASTLVQVGARLPDVLAQASGQAAACVAAAADAAATASASFNVTLQASAKVTAGVGADVH